MSGLRVLWCHCPEVFHCISILNVLVLELFVDSDRVPRF